VRKKEEGPLERPFPLLLAAVSTDHLPKDNNPNLSSNFRNCGVHAFHLLSYWSGEEATTIKPVILKIRSWRQLDFHLVVGMAIGLFIDGAYLRKAYGLSRKINYLALREFIERELDDRVDEGYYFDADTDPPKLERLLNALTNPPPYGPGLRPKIYWLQKKLLCWPASLGGHPVMHPFIADKQYELTQQKAVDVSLVFHMTRSYHLRRWSNLVLVAGDGDFHVPVQSLVEEQNVDLHLVGTRRSLSINLVSHARRLFEIDQEPLLSLLQNETPNKSGRRQISRKR
jgi:uncharacterized LabA/DUF88 family protein